MTRILVAGFALVSALAMAGCDYFRPADPEAPSDQTAFLPNYSDPDSTLQTIALAIGDKGVTIGGVAYATAFAESVSASSTIAYHHFFWPEDVAVWQSITGRPPPGDWGFALEQTFYTRFVRLRPDEYRMTWVPDPPNPDDRGANEATLHRRYLVTTHAINGNQTSVQAVGFADLRLERFPDGNWRITRWNDRRDPDADPNDPEQVTLGRRRLNSQ